MTKKLSYEYVKEFIENEGYKLISTEYNNCEEKLDLICPEGHEIKATYNSFRSGSRCKICFFNTRRYSFEYVKSYIESQGCVLLSSEYVNEEEKLKIQCSCGNSDWQCTFTNFLRGRRCSRCRINHLAEQKRFSDEYVRSYIENEGCEWIDGKYETNASILLLKCSCGRSNFSTSFAHFKDGGRCNLCFRDGQRERILKRTVTIENNLQFLYPELVEKEWDFVLNGENLPNQFAPKSKYDAWWICPNGHSYQSKIRNRTSLNRGCPYCAHRKPTDSNNLFVLYPYLIEEWDFNKNKKHPKEYLPRSSAKVSWKCKECGNEWKSTISNRVIGNGCPACGLSGGAKLIKYLLETKEIPFQIEYTFNDLVSDIGRNLRYDFAVFGNLDKTELLFLIEFDSKIHDEYIPFYHKTIDAFERYITHDKMKTSFAKRNEIPLLRIKEKELNNIEIILEEALNLHQEGKEV